MNKYDSITPSSSEVAKVRYLCKLYFVWGMRFISVHFDSLAVGLQPD